MKIRDEGAIQALITQIVGPLREEDAQLRAFHAHLRADLAFPFEAQVIGETVQVTSLRYDGNPRRGIVATIRREGRQHDLSLVDLWFDISTRQGQALAAYRLWVRLPQPTPTWSPGLPQSFSPPSARSETEEEAVPHFPLEILVLAAHDDSALVRHKGSRREFCLQSGFSRDLVPGESITFIPDRMWSHRNQHFATGEIRSRRIDIEAIQVDPLWLKDQGPWDPADEYWGRPGEPIPPCYVPIIQYGQRPSFELQFMLPGYEPESDFREEPVSRALRLHEEGHPQEARKILMDILALDLRCLDAHAHLGFFAYLAHPEQALMHYKVGVRIGEKSFPEGFMGVLPWRFPGNRAFLRCLHGLGLCLWRLGCFADSGAILDRLLWLDPGDQQGVHGLIGKVREGSPWSGESVQG